MSTAFSYTITCEQLSSPDVCRAVSEIIRFSSTGLTENGLTLTIDNSLLTNTEVQLKISALFAALSSCNKPTVCIPKPEPVTASSPEVVTVSVVDNPFEEKNNTPLRRVNVARTPSGGVKIEDDEPPKEEIAPSRVKVTRVQQNKEVVPPKVEVKTVGDSSNQSVSLQVTVPVPEGLSMTESSIKEIQDRVSSRVSTLTQSPATSGLNFGFGNEIQSMMSHFTGPAPGIKRRASPTEPTTPIKPDVIHPAVRNVMDILVATSATLPAGLLSGWIKYAIKDCPNVSFILMAMGVHVDQPDNRILMGQVINLLEMFAPVISPFCETVMKEYEKNNCTLLDLINLVGPVLSYLAARYVPSPPTEK